MIPHSRHNVLLAAGHDAPFTNNYGVWLDEFQDMGLEHCLETSWTDAVCYFGEAAPVRVSPGNAVIAIQSLQ